MKKLKVMTILGTRPEIIRLSRTMALLDKHVNQVIVHTGQNYDYHLNEIFWNELELRKPDHFMNADRSSIGATIGDIIKKSEEVMLKEKPDALLVLGDTNSCLSAYIAKRLRIPIFHMEAGNRSFDLNVPEEINRRIIDHISDFNLVYTEHARRHLISEGLPHRRIYLTGSPMKEVLDYYSFKIKNSDALKRLNDQLKESQSNVRLNTKDQAENKNFENTGAPILKNCKPNNYFLVSIHREENVDNKENLKKIITILNQLAKKYNLPIIVSTHPRTRNKLESLITNNQKTLIDTQIQFMKPFGFFEYIALQKYAKCVLSDSGTISEESSILYFPAISLRQSMERPEAQDTGSIILTGFEPETVLSAIETVIFEFQDRSKSNDAKIKVSNIKNHIASDQLTYNSNMPMEYQINNTSRRVLKLILGNTKLSNKWWAIEE